MTNGANATLMKCMQKKFNPQAQSKNTKNSTESPKTVSQTHFWIKKIGTKSPRPRRSKGNGNAKQEFGIKKIFQMFIEYYADAGKSQ